MGLNNSTKARSATLDDLREILENYGDRPQIVLGVAVAVKDARFGTESSKVWFLIDLLNYVHRDLSQREIADDDSMISLHLGLVSHKICVEIVDQLLEHQGKLFKMVGKDTFPLRDLLRFLGDYPPLDGLRSGIRCLLEMVAGECCVLRGGASSAAAITGCPKLAGIYPSHLDLVVRALVCYQMFDHLKQFVRAKIYEAIRPVFEAVVAQVGVAEADCIWEAVKGGWGASEAVAEAFRLVGDDARALRILIDLSQAYRDEHRKHYPGPF